ncbi:MAG TPA: phosphatidylglycerophosphatase A [Sediminibacterium sp.]|nr:phosphatidylglycerophosphatase A [Sediminibacterium sp.]
MIRLHQAITSFFGIGYIPKGGGTVAAAVACIIWYYAFNQAPLAVAAGVTLLIITYGVWGAGKMEPLWGKDSSRVVIDEVAGMFVNLLFVPVSIPNILAALVLFRFFDIAKPLLIRRTEQLPKGWGVMGDDVLAGFYGNIALQIMLYLQLW